MRRFTKSDQVFEAFVQDEYEPSTRDIKTGLAIMASTLKINPDVLETMYKQGFAQKVSIRNETIVAETGRNTKKLQEFNRLCDKCLDILDRGQAA